MPQIARKFAHNQLNYFLHIYQGLRHSLIQAKLVNKSNEDQVLPT